MQKSLKFLKLYDTVYQSKPPVIDGLLHPGTYLFVGAPKLGKSFLMAQLAYHVSTGKIIRTLARKVYELTDKAKQLNAQVKKLEKANDRLKAQSWNITMEGMNLHRELKDYEKLKAILGVDKIKEVLRSARKKNRKQER